MRSILIIFFLVTNSISSAIEEDIWWKGESLLTFLDKNNISKDIYFNLSKTDKELCSEITAGIEYQVLYDHKHRFQQALIPISEHMQIHIFKKNRTNYDLDIIPISFKEITQTIAIPITYTPSQDIVTATNNKALAHEFVRAFRKTINFKRIQKGDILTLKYTQKIRQGRYFGIPSILGVRVEVNGSAKYIFQNLKDRRYYDNKGRSFTSYFLKVPLRYSRISSKFTHKRWHPILKRYRAHLGIDYAAPVGRKIFATAGGKVIFKGRRGGYGKTVIIRHKGGYKSLYAHMHKYANIRVGQTIRQGKHIGYVGSTGKSTGPHLHFGLYKNGRAINPSRVLRITKNGLAGKSKRKYLKYAKIIKNELIKESKIVSKPMKLAKFNLSYKTYFQRAN